MPRRTQKRHRSAARSEKSKKTEVMTIPELRRSFEHMETFALHNKHKKDAIALFQEEWFRVFKKKLEKKAAAVYIQHVQADNRKQGGGGTHRLEGAVLDYDTRPGLYISPGVNQGSYARVPNYVQSGFWNPESGQSYDRVPGQTIYPSRTPLGLGDNTVIGLKGGARKSKTAKKQQQQQGGADPLSAIGTAFNQFIFRPVGGSIPASVGQDLQTAVRGQELGPSPRADQNHLKYQMNSRLYSGNVNISPITAHLKTDIRSN